MAHDRPLARLRTSTVILAQLVSLAAAKQASDAVTVSFCGAGGWRGWTGLEVRWKAVPRSDYYEVQLLTNATGNVFAIVSTGATHAVVQDAIPGTTYWVRLRAHEASAPGLGPGTWGSPGPVAECQLPRSMETPQRVQDVPSLGRKKPPHTFWLEVMRESEYTSDVDYLTNHDSGDVVGDVAMVTASVSSGRRPPDFFGNFTKSTYTLYCVEVLKVSVPDTITTGGDDRFADYLSCNLNEDHRAPECACDVWIDRVIANQDPNPYCHVPTGGPCDMQSWLKRNCTCTCTEHSLRMSAKYTGKTPVGVPVQLGNWYSHPKAGECRETEEVGVIRRDGSQCTWKTRPDARVVHGLDLLHAGFNTSSTGFIDPPHVDPSQVYQNVNVFRRVVASGSLRPWQCGGEHFEQAIIV